MLQLKLALQFLKRELLHADLTLLFIAIIIAISSLSSIGFLLKRFDHSIFNHAAQLNGADLSLKSPTEAPQLWLQYARSTGLKQAKMVSFPSMLVQGNQFKLAQIKAVSDNFPLLGKLMVKAGINQAAQQRHSPLMGTIWLDKRLFQYFKFTDQTGTDNSLSDEKTVPKTNLSSDIELGQAIFQTDGILASVPGQSSSSLFKIAPSAIINLADLTQTATIQAGSRVDYIYFFSGPEAAIQSYKNWLKTKINPGQTLRYGVEGIQALKANIKKSESFISLAALLTVLLSAIAIAISSYHYGKKQYKNNAILLCLGFREELIIQIELLKLLLLGLFSSMLGVLIGYIIHLLLLQLLSDLLPQPIAALSLMPIWMGLASGTLLIITISMANLLRLRQLSPLALLRKDYLPKQVNQYLLYGLSLLTLVLLSWLYTQDIVISVLFYVLIICTLLVLLFISKLLTQGLFWLNQHLSFINPLTQLNLRQHQAMSLLQIATFSLILALVLIIYLVSTDLLEQWQQQLPTNTPNHFAINIQADETKSFKQQLGTENIQSSGLFPMVRGRLSYLNDQPIMAQLALDKQSHNALNRELNLSFAAKMQAHNQLIKGKWWQTADTKTQTSTHTLPEISLENSLAKELGLKIGDKLGFQIGSQQVHAIVSNLRKVKWDSFQPNFYIIFPPNALEQFPLSYISSFYLNKQQKKILNQLIVQFPGITIIEVDQILDEVLYIIKKLSIAIDVIFIFILIAGLLILISSFSTTVENRMYENAIIRTLGASAKKLRYSLLIEFIIIAIFSAVIGLIIAESVSAVLYWQIFNLTYHFHPWLWLQTIAIALFVISGIGLLLVNKIFTQPVNHSLNQFSD
jgi:putative ABC transport system permease protein